MKPSINEVLSDSGVRASVLICDLNFLILDRNIHN